MSNEFANSVVAQVATQANVNDESFQNCLASTDLENQLKNITENTEKYGAKNENALFVNNREIIISKMLNVEVTLNSIAAEYLKR
jgi:vacuolar-type H+-ATPase subunit B/Vma2